jgi:hypothetical protein
MVLRTSTVVNEQRIFVEPFELGAVFESVSDDVYCQRSGIHFVATSHIKGQGDYTELSYGRFDS